MSRIGGGKERRPLQRPGLNLDPKKDREEKPGGQQEEVGAKEGGGGAIKTVDPSSRY